MVSPSNPPDDGLTSPIVIGRHAGRNQIGCFKNRPIVVPAMTRFVARSSHCRPGMNWMGCLLAYTLASIRFTCQLNASLATFHKQANEQSGAWNGTPEKQKPDDHDVCL